MSPHPMTAPLTAADVQRLVSQQLSLPSRVGHIALLLVALAAVGVTASLWATEVGLPLRTHIAFGGVTLVGVSWVAYAWWVLRNRRVLLATHRLVAARMAVVFSAAFVIGCTAVALAAPAGKAAFVAAAFGGVMCAAAVWLLRRAHDRVQALRSRRDEIARALAGEPGGH